MLQVADMEDERDEIDTSFTRLGAVAAALVERLILHPEPNAAPNNDPQHTGGGRDRKAEGKKENGVSEGHGLSPRNSEKDSRDRWSANAINLGQSDMREPLRRADFIDLRLSELDAATATGKFPDVGKVALVINGVAAALAHRVLVIVHCRTGEQMIRIDAIGVVASMANLGIGGQTDIVGRLVTRSVGASDAAIDPAYAVTLDVHRVRPNPAAAIRLRN